MQSTATRCCASSAMAMRRSRRCGPPGRSDPGGPSRARSVRALLDPPEVVLAGHDHHHLVTRQGRAVGAVARVVDQQMDLAGAYQQRLYLVVDAVAPAALRQLDEIIRIDLARLVPYHEILAGQDEMREMQQRIHADEVARVEPRREGVDRGEGVADDRLEVVRRVKHAWFLGATERPVSVL